MEHGSGKCAVPDEDAEPLSQVVRESLLLMVGTLRNVNAADFSAADAVQWMRYPKRLTHRRSSCGRWRLPHRLYSRTCTRRAERQGDAWYWVRRRARRPLTAPLGAAPTQLLHVELVVVVDNILSTRVEYNVRTVRE